MSRLAVFAVLGSLLVASCGGGSGDDDRITRIDGPAVVEDE